MENPGNDFRFIISEWMEKELPPLVKREVEIPLDERIVVSIAGGRQVGKTFRVYQSIEELLSKGFPRENVLYVNFENERLWELRASDLDGLLRTFYELSDVDKKLPLYLFLDEIQRVQGWERWVRRIYDNKNFRIFITGSSSKITSREIATSLRGRSIDYLLFPFSFREVLKAKGISFLPDYPPVEQQGKVMGLLRDYVVGGGYPKIVLTESEEVKRKLAISYYEAIFYKDLIDSFHVEEPAVMDGFLKYSMYNFSKYVSISKIYNYFKSLGLRTSKGTLLDYLEYSNKVFFSFPVEIFSKSIKTRKQYPRKLYFIDPSVITSIYTELASDVGRLMENCVAIQLMRERERNRTDVFYWREYGNASGREVDFVVTKGPKVKELIQVTYASGRDEVDKREVNGLLKASQELNCKNLRIITWDFEDVEKVRERKIEYVPLWKWLLGL